MKTTAPLLLAISFLFITAAHAAQSHLEADVLVLPTYVVHAPSYQSLEKKIKANLREACRNNRSTLAITRLVSLPKIQTNVTGLSLNLPEAKTRQKTKS